MAGSTNPELAAAPAPADPRSQLPGLMEAHGDDWRVTYFGRFIATGRSVDADGNVTDDLSRRAESTSAADMDRQLAVWKARQS